jgi:hypothetical protein
VIVNLPSTSVIVLVSLSAITDAKVVCHLMQQLQVRSLEIVLEAKGREKKKKILHERFISKRR